MTAELLYTSAAKGLKPGSRGFCTVLSSSGMPANLATKLESISGYRQMFPPSSPEASKNPVAFSHLTFKLGGQMTSVLSRVAAYGADYSGRTNKLAHHVVPSVSEKVAAGPAWLLMQAGVMRSQWDGDCQTTPSGPTLPNGNLSPQVCSTWQRLAGDAGWGGVVAEAFRQVRGKPLFVVYPLEQQSQLLQLLVEATALLPPEQRWQATFSTYAAQLPPDVSCQVRCVVEGTQDAQMARARGSIIHLGASNGAPPVSEWVEIARGTRQSPAFTSVSPSGAVSAPKVPRPATPPSTTPESVLPDSPTDASNVPTPILPPTKVPAAPSLPPSATSWGGDELSMAPPSPVAGGQVVESATMVAGYEGYGEAEWVDPSQRKSSSLLPWVLVGLAMVLLLIVSAGVLIFDNQGDADLAANAGDATEEDATKENVNASGVVVNEGNEADTTGVGGSNSSSSQASDSHGNGSALENNGNEPAEEGGAQETSGDIPDKGGEQAIVELKIIDQKKVVIGNLNPEVDYEVEVKGPAKINKDSLRGITPNEIPGDHFRIGTIASGGEATSEASFDLKPEGVKFENRKVTVVLKDSSASEKVIAERTTSLPLPWQRVKEKLITALKMNDEYSGSGLKEGSPIVVDIAKIGILGDAEWGENWNLEASLADPGKQYELEVDGAGFCLKNEHVLDVSIDKEERSLFKLNTSTPQWTMAGEGDVYVSLKLIDENGLSIFDSGVAEEDSRHLKVTVGSEGISKIRGEWLIAKNPGWKLPIEGTEHKRVVQHPFRDKKNISHAYFSCDRYPPLPIEAGSTCSLSFSFERPGGELEKKKFDSQGFDSKAFLKTGGSAHSLFPKEQYFAWFSGRNLNQSCITPGVRVTAKLEIEKFKDKLPLELDFIDPEPLLLLTQEAEYLSQQSFKQLRDAGDLDANWISPKPPEIGSWETLGLGFIGKQSSKLDQMVLFSKVSDYQLAEESSDNLKVVVTVDEKSYGLRYNSDDDYWETIKPIDKISDFRIYPIMDEKRSNAIQGYHIKMTCAVNPATKNYLKGTKQWYENSIKNTSQIPDKDLEEFLESLEEDINHYDEMSRDATRRNVNEPWGSKYKLELAEQNLSKEVESKIESYAKARPNKFRTGSPGQKPHRETPENQLTDDQEKAIEKWNEKKAQYQAYVDLRVKVKNHLSGLIGGDGTKSIYQELKERLQVPVKVELKIIAEGKEKGRYRIPSDLEIR